MSSKTSKSFFAVSEETLETKISRCLCFVEKLCNVFTKYSLRRSGALLLTHFPVLFSLGSCDFLVHSNGWKWLKKTVLIFLIVVTTMLVSHVKQFGGSAFLRELEKFFLLQAWQVTSSYGSSLAVKPVKQQIFSLSLLSSTTL